MAAAVVMLRFLAALASVAASRDPRPRHAEVQRLKQLARAIEDATRAASGG